MLKNFSIFSSHMYSFFREFCVQFHSPVLIGLCVFLIFFYWVVRRFYTPKLCQISSWQMFFSFCRIHPNLTKSFSGRKVNEISLVNCLSYFCAIRSDSESLYLFLSSEVYFLRVLGHMLRSLMHLELSFLWHKR